jgi:hypothetical protein
MGLLDKLLGRPHPKAPPFHYDAPPRRPTHRMGDEEAIERYRYLLRTAPPEAIEKVHQEAFARLTPEQRALVLRDLSSLLPPYERDALAHAGTDPRALARLATRAEMREPGIMERMLGRWGSPGGVGGPSLGTGLLGGFLAGFAGSMLANQLYDVFHNGADEGEGFLGDADGFQGGSALEPDDGTVEAGYGAGGVDEGAGGADDAAVDADFDGDIDVDI